jgi:secondary thiamine-phosphate synthase enzyme
MKRFVLEIHSDGNTDILNLNDQINTRLRDITGIGLIHIFVVGSTAALTTVEFEPGLVKQDIPAIMQKLIPDDIHYAHEATWNDDNGHSHIRASLVGPSLTIPFGEGRLLTGEYQQVVLMDFDTRPRRRSIICTIIQ